MKKITILLLAIAAVASGCKKFTNINNNPNQPTVVTPNVVLSAALVGSASDIANDFQYTSRWMGYWSRSGNYIEDIPTETYVLQTTYSDGDFQSLYTVMTRYNYIEHNSAGDPFYVGVAKTMKALHFSALVDGFGNVPYSQAFNLNQYPTPVYDDQKTIYADLVAQCDSAVTYFQQAITFYSTAPSTIVKTDDQYDIVYGRGAGVNPTTRVNEWIAFANTVKLKLLITAQNGGGAFTNAFITAEIAKITANGQGFIPANGSAAVNPGYSSAANSKENPFYGDFYLTSGATNNDYAYYRANNYYLNYGQSTGDPRYSDDYQYFGNFVWAGNYDGDPLSQPNSNTSGLGPGVLHSAAQDELLISDFESLFWQSEATFEGYLPGGAAAATALADRGTEQSFIYVDDYGDGVAADNITDADTFLGIVNGGTGTGNPLTDPSVGGLQAIMTLKWSALNGINWYQAYADYRRTGYPYPDGTNFGFSHANNVFHHSSPDVKGINQPINLPYRFLYPQSELNTNGKNVPAGVTAYTPVFWDTREK